MANVIVVDTGVLYAVADRSDADHDACDNLLNTFAGDLVVPTPVVVESAWLIGSRLGAVAEAKFLGAVVSGELRRHDLTDTDWERVLALVETYSDLDLGVVDASVVAVAEHIGADAIATLNHRDFTVVRPNHVEAFQLLP
jgi:hypothetical protein